MKRNILKKPYCPLKNRRIEKTKVIESFSVHIMFWPTLRKGSFLILDPVIDIFLDPVIDIFLDPVIDIFSRHL